MIKHVRHLGRRSFLRSLIGGAVTIAAANAISTGLLTAIDPEKLLWIPGAKTIFIPAEANTHYLTVDMIARETLAILKNKLEFSYYNYAKWDRERFIDEHYYGVRVERIKYPVVDFDKALEIGRLND